MAFSWFSAHPIIIVKTTIKHPRSALFAEVHNSRLLLLLLLLPPLELLLLELLDDELELLLALLLRPDLDADLDRDLLPAAVLVASPAAGAAGEVGAAILPCVDLFVLRGICLARPTRTIYNYIVAGAITLLPEKLCSYALVRSTAWR